MKITRPIKGVRVIDITDDTSPDKIFNRMEEKIRLRNRLKEVLSKELSLDQKEKLYESKMKLIKFLEESYGKVL